MASAPFTPHRSRQRAGLLDAAVSISLSPLDSFGLWLGETLEHAFGNPREEAAHQPPLVGVQPYRDRPRRRRHR